MPSAATDSVCNGLDDDCDGLEDEEFAPAATSCGVGVCRAMGSTSCVSGVLVDSCQAGSPQASDDSCDNLDNDCNGQVDDGYVGTVTHCGYGACEATGNTECSAGHVVDNCRITCEGNCADGAEDDGDGLVDCADPDCKNNPVWPQCTDGQIGSPCKNSQQCAPGYGCELSFPGGYCYRSCALDPVCPNGSFCWAGSACMQPCVGAANNRCPRPEHVCSPLSPTEVPDPFCRPDCNQTCPVGTTCRADTMQCVKVKT
jgi:hypothetical protein